MSYTFKDHFSTNSSGYSRFRPVYPSALYQYLATLTQNNDLAWDCATGSGQAARQLAQHFKQVIATDASESQIKAATPCNSIVYRVCPAEQTDLPDQSIDLVTVAQALHWFDLEPFYAEVKRVLVKRGIIAVWTYNLFRLSPEIDALVNQLYRVTLANYWPAERQLVENGYADLPFPFKQVQEIPEFAMTAHWSLPHMLGYLRTWSAVTRCIDVTGNDPVTQIAAQLEQAWGDPTQERAVAWPLSMRIGINP
ncbi:MAG: class I SAM-dependent methyltransferase [Sedimenticola sp.]|nr:class I SAM-dependent methyltransferase [Sedimenticola sp.]